MKSKEDEVDKLTKTVASLERIIKGMPRAPNSTKFALLEKKLELIDKNHKE